MKTSKELIIAMNILTLAIFLPTAVVFLKVNTTIGYIMSAVFFGFSCYVGYYFYLLLWFHRRPLSEEKIRKREQWRKQVWDYQRYNIYNRLYRFGDLAEEEYPAEKARETAKRVS